MTKKILILGAGGFIGSHLANRLAGEGNTVFGVDQHLPKLTPLYDHFFTEDLRDPTNVPGMFYDEPFDEVYQLAADMGGAGFVFTGENDADILFNSSIINLNVTAAIAHHQLQTKRVFFSSSACVYKENPDDPRTPEESAYPANPDSNYGWEKIFSERLYQAYAKNYGIATRIARYHNIFGPYGTFEGGREKAPAAICRKVAKAQDGDFIKLWGDGTQKRSFLYIDDCVEGTIRLMRSDFEGPVNIGSEEVVTIDELARMIIFISNKRIGISYTGDGPIGVHGRNSDNALLREKLNWEPKGSLVEGLRKTYTWINEQVNGVKNA